MIERFFFGNEKIIDSSLLRMEDLANSSQNEALKWSHLGSSWEGNDLTPLKETKIAVKCNLNRPIFFQ